MQPQPVIQVLKRNSNSFHPVIPFDAAKDKMSRMNLHNTNEWQPGVFNNIDLFTKAVNEKRTAANSRYLAGGYNELRTMYERSELFNDKEPRRLHLGLDIWGEAGTPVYAFMGGMIHSFAFNSTMGDYGATLILLHQLDAISFYTLYGHISLKDIENISPGQYVNHGQVIAHFGKPAENGCWPPHLHLQVIADMQLYEGDYPGVCKFSEKEKYLYNCPDPELVAKLQQYIID
jgi:peptidoglycan LD-endopeptidase LytH